MNRTIREADRPAVLVMGVSGAGKSTIGAALAGELGVPFVDGDDLHPRENITKMADGIALNDDDRLPWLEQVGQTLATAIHDGAGMVVACSALTRGYRAVISREAPTTIFVMLDGSLAELRRNLSSREGHFMPGSLLESQLALLEPLGCDERGKSVSIGAPVPAVVSAALAAVDALCADLR